MRPADRGRHGPQDPGPLLGLYLIFDSRAVGFPDSSLSEA